MVTVLYFTIRSLGLVCTSRDVSAICRQLGTRCGSKAMLIRRQCDNSKPRKLFALESLDGIRTPEPISYWQVDQQTPGQD